MPKLTSLLVDALRVQGCEVIAEPWGRAGDNEARWRKVPRLVRDIATVRRRLRVGSFDGIVVHTSHDWRALGRDIPLLLAVRGLVGHVVIQFHGGRSDLLGQRGHFGFKLASRLLFRYADGIFVLSTAEAREGERFYPDRRFVTVANPYARRASRPRPATVNGVPVILFAGRLIPEKGIFDTLEAVALLRSRIECRLVVAGTGSSEADARHRARALGLGTAVEFTGHLATPQLHDMYRRADLFVLPTYWAEGFPTVIAEAMDAGLPIVTTNTRGIADHLRDGENAVFVSPRDPQLLAASLENVIRDDALRERMGRANERKVEEFAPERVASEYLVALESIIGGHRTELPPKPRG
ncbi:MAG: glycosyltransferase family 4 protein [Mycobacterium sp.]